MNQISVDAFNSEVTVLAFHMNMNYEKILIMTNNQIIKLNIAHNEGNYFTSSDHVKNMQDQELIAFQYSNNNGDIHEDFNPNGSIANIAGILNEKKNILGMMPHPERMTDKLIVNEDGLGLFSSILN